MGKIARLQIQPAGLRVGIKPDSYYDPSSLLTVSELTLSLRGAAAVSNGGDVLLDIHHEQHPHSKNSRGLNDLSVGFTAHYSAIRERYGDHIADGCAGENILIEAEAIVELGDLERGLVIRRGGAPPVRLENFAIARPCAPFSSYVSRSAEGRIVKQAMQFLDNGRRGFYCALRGREELSVAIGDEVFAPAD